MKVSAGARAGRKYREYSLKINRVKKQMQSINLLCLKNAGLLPFRNLFSLEPLESGTCLLLDLT